MARTTTLPTKNFPSNASSGSTPATVGSPSWTYGAWVERVASASTDLYLVALGFGQLSAGQFQVQVGIGAVSSEVPIGTFRFHLTNSGTDDLPQVYALPAALLIPSGSRLVFRVAENGTTGTYHVLLHYVENLDSDNVHSGTPTCLPNAASASNLAGSGTDWAPSAWLELSASLADSIDVYGLTWGIGGGPNNLHLEWDIGVGASSSEVVVTTLRSSKNENNGGNIQIAMLPAFLPIAAGERVSVRIRKGGTDTANWVPALLAYTPTAVPRPMLVHPGMTGRMAELSGGMRA